MKTVFTNPQCVHVWAAQSQEHGRTPSHGMSFEGPTIFSYRTAIARIHTLSDGTKLVLVNSSRYSVTTSSKHMPAVTRAIRHLPSIGVLNINPTNDDRHAFNMAYLRAEYQSYLDSLKRRRDVREGDYQRLEELAANARRYAVAFNLPVYPDGYVQNDIRNMQVFRTERDARLNTPQAIAARERAKVKRDAKRTEKEIADRLERETRAQLHREEQEARRIEEARSLPERIEKWRRGEQTFGLHSIPPMLRVSKSGTEVQTSHGASIPLLHGFRALRFIREVWADIGAGTFNAATDARIVGAFRIDSISPTHVKARCHNFERAEIETFMVTLGELHGQTD